MTTRKLLALGLFLSFLPFEFGRSLVVVGTPDVLITGFFPCDRFGVPLNYYPVGTTAYSSVSLRNFASESKNITITVSVLDVTDVPVGIDQLNTAILPNSTEHYIMGVFLPKWARIGLATAIATVYVEGEYSDGETTHFYIGPEDLTPPTVGIWSPENITYGESNLVPLIFTTNERPFWMGYSLDGRANATITGNTTLTVGDGSHWTIVYVNDTSGNMGASSPVCFTSDTMPPGISILSPENTAYTTDAVSLTFAVDEPVSWMGYSLDGQANATITGNTTLTWLSDGIHSIVVYARDMAGNTGSSDTACFTVDTDPPGILITSPENRAYNTADVPLTINVNEPTSWIGYSLDGQGNVTVLGNTTLNALSLGLHYLVVYADDSAGNTGSSAMVYFTVDTIFPNVSIASPRNTTYYSSLLSLAFAVDEPTSWIGYSLDGQTNATLSGNCTIMVEEGSHWIILYANDTAGNMGCSNIVCFTARTGAIDIKISQISVSKTVVGKGYSVVASVTILNQGDYDEAFNFTLYANATAIYELEDCFVQSRGNLNLSVIWWTTGIEKGYYEINAHASPVPGETDETNNNATAGYIHVTLPGDVDGDRDVDIFDLVLVAGGYRIKPLGPKYDPNCDIDGDGDIDIFDIVVVAGNYGRSW